MNASGCAALVLAAGGSRRLGRPKQLLRWEGITLLRRAAMAALGSGASPVLCVLGHEAAACGAEIADLPVHAVLHPGWQEGMATSLRAGLAALADLAPAATGLLVLPCDQPRVDAELLRRLLAAAAVPACPLVACRYAGAYGPPAIFPTRCFTELERLTGDRGARAVLAAHAAELVVVDFPGGAEDVDRAEDLARLTIGAAGAAGADDEGA